MTTYNLASTIPAADALKTGDILNLEYCGTYKTVKVPKGTYRLEVWGAQGGSYNTSFLGGAGGYSYGEFTLTDASTVLNLYPGQQPATLTNDRVSVLGGWNGGGNGYNRYYSNVYTYGQGGGGGSDIRIKDYSPYSRVIVAGGGGGACNGDNRYNKYGGGLTGGSPIANYGGGQTAAGTNGAFHKGGTATTDGNNYKYGSGGGGGGWYGGGAYTSYSDTESNLINYNGGGSGYVYSASTASSYPSGCTLISKYYLAGETLAGNTTFIQPNGTTSQGHLGHGYCRITCVLINSFDVYQKSNGSWRKITSAMNGKAYRYG